jgi:hypothetical protein
VSQFVIPAKAVDDGREPGSRKSVIVLDLDWIPDLARLSGLVRNDGSLRRERYALYSMPYLS